MTEVIVGGIIVGIVLVAAVVFLVARKQGGDAKETPGNKLDEKPDREKPLPDLVKEALEKLREIFTSELSYEEAMKYFIEHKNDSPAIAKGAILRESTGDGLIVTQVFLDKDNQLVIDSAGNPLGCKIKVKQLDDELLRLFKDGNLVMVE